MSTVEAVHFDSNKQNVNELYSVFKTVYPNFDFGGARAPIVRTYDDATVGFALAGDLVWLLATMTHVSLRVARSQ